VFIVVEGAGDTDLSAAADVGWDLDRQVGALAGVVKHDEQMWRSWQGSFFVDLVTLSERHNIYVQVSGVTPSGGPQLSFRQQVANPPAGESWTVMLSVPERRGLSQDPWAAVQQTFPAGCGWGAVNAFRWDRSAREIIPAVIARAGLAPADNRIFISYLRRETSAIADQLFVALTKRGFDVFLDRFSVQAGVRFQDHLMQELDDKAVVVVLHSKGVASRKSSWVEKELARVKRFGHGVVVLSLPIPSGTAPSPRLDLSPDTVRVVSPAELTGRKLRSPALKEAVDSVCEAHARCLVRRRAELRESLGVELVAYGKASQVYPGGDVECGSAPGIMVRASSRPPEVRDFSGLHSQLGKAIIGACLTPAPLVLLDRQADVRWLESVSGIGHLDQENLRDFVRTKVQ
jgi:hypothetical protein